jgi:hypothetical protein
MMCYKLIITFNIYKIGHEKNRNLLRLRVFDPPRLAPYLLEMGGQPLKSNLKKKAKNPSDHLAKMVIRSC